jgi:hypothetical protein
MSLPCLSPFKVINPAHFLYAAIYTSILNKLKPCKFYLAAGKNDKPLIDKIISSPIGKNCISFENLSIRKIYYELSCIL